MNEPSVLIQKVMGGYIVTLFTNKGEQPNQYEQAAQAFAEILPGADPMLKANKGQPVYERGLPTSKNVHVFDGWEKVLAFLQSLED